MELPNPLRAAEGHAVQFYEREEFLRRELAGFVALGLRQDEAVIVIATHVHLANLRGSLQAAGLEPETAATPGRLLCLDADETLQLIMVDGQPDPLAFEHHVTQVVHRAGSGGRRVRAFGEMVAVLLAAGRIDATLQLESLWNQLIDRVPIDLLCAYPLRAFRSCDESVFVSVCKAHSKVVPAESYPGPIDDEERAWEVSLSQLRALRG